MKWFKNVICLVALSGSLVGAQLELKDGDRVALVGGTFVEREAEQGFIETYLTLANRDKEIQFRNFGWSADTVRGDSRGYFKVAEGYGLLLQKVSNSKPSAIVLTYGANASWSGKAGLQSFIKNYSALINDLKIRTKARIILMSTPRQENLGAPYPKPLKHNTNQQLYFSAVAQLAQQQGLDFIDLFNELGDVTGLTSNSIHLNEDGYRKVAEVLSGLKKSHPQVITKTGLKPGKYKLQAKGRTLILADAKTFAKGIEIHGLKLHERLLQKEILEKNEQFFHSWRPQNTTYLFDFRKHEQGQNGKEIKEFLTYIDKHEEKIQQLKNLEDISYEIVPQIMPVLSAKRTGEELILSADDELKTFTLPEDLELNLFAAEPMIINPTNMNWDNEGRLWVACAPGYPQIKPGHMASDQIVVLEDTNNDGKADKRHVFVDNVLIPTAVLPGNGGVYVANSTEIVHYKDTDGDMKADSKKVIMSGFGTEDTHHIIHTPQWGQDGMLYFSQSVYIHSHIETPWGVKRLMAGGIWQYNPHTEKLKVYSRGLINAWGFSIDKYGQTFATDGAGNQGINYLFPDVAQVTAHGTNHLYPGLNPGQPKHCGLEIISGNHFPEKYQGLLVTNDFRGHRINTFRLKEHGSAFISRQEGDLMSTGSGKIDFDGKDGGFRPVDVKMGPDGALYIADWSNIIIQHGEVDFRDARRDQSHGRIWRITAKDKALSTKPLIAQASTEQLLANLKSDDRYTIDKSKRELIERGAQEVIPKLNQFLSQEQSDYTKLQALWLRVGLNTPDNQLLKEMLGVKDYRIRAAVIRIAAQQYLEMAGLIDSFKISIKDDSPIVRLETVNALRLIQSTQSVEVALQALDSELDKTIDYALVLNVRTMMDHWIGKTLFNGNSKHLTYAVNASRNPKALLALYQAYKAGEIPTKNQDDVLRLIGELGNHQQVTELYNLAMMQKTSPTSRKVILQSLLKTSQSRGIKPQLNFDGLGKYLSDKQLSSVISQLIGEWQIVSLVPQLAPSALQGEDASLTALAKIKSPKSEQVLLSVIEKNKSTQISVKAIAALASINMKSSVEHSLAAFEHASADLDYGPIFEVILKDKEGPAILSHALKGRKINAAVALLGVQRANMGGRDLSQLILSLSKAGELKPMKHTLSPQELLAMVKAVREKGNPHLGENIYRKQSIACINCHAIGGAGPKIGPDLISIGASAPVDYLIESILQPSKKIKEGYHMTMVSTKDGQMIAGSQVSANKEQVLIRDALGNITKIPTRNIKRKEVNPMSMMPPGLASSLSEEEFIHLIAFLSELGKEGDFKMSPKRTIRSFGTTGEAINKRTWNKLKTLSFNNNYAKVDGTIPLKDKSMFPSSTPVIKFDLEVIKKGQLTLQFSTIEDLNAFKINREKLKVDPVNKTASIEVDKGKTSIIILLNKSFKEDDLKIAILENKTTALVKLN